MNTSTQQHNSPAQPPVDAIILASFGGPEGPEDVIPFLENVTRGRGIPRERLAEVGQHYAHFGGVSPLNALNRNIIDRLQAQLDARPQPLPVYFANRNWHPFFADTLEQMAREGKRNALVFATSAWAGYSGCRQYDEDIRAAQEEVVRRGMTPPTLTKLRQFYDHPLFVEAQAQAIRDALATFPGRGEVATCSSDNAHDPRSTAVESTGLAAATSAVDTDGIHLVFTAHSIPLTADAASGDPSADGAHLYSRQIREAAELTARAAGFDPATIDVVWQSRSGPAHVPWLEPDIVDHIADLHERGVKEVIVVPIGFVSDHVEVVWDLDTELAQESKEFDMTIVRAKTVGESDTFIRMILDLIDEHILGLSPSRLGTTPQHGCTSNGEPCSAGCCIPPQRHGHAGASGSGRPNGAASS